MKTRTRMEKVGTGYHKGVKIELSCRKGGVGRTDYGYRLPSGVWGTGFGTKRGALAAAKRAIREGKR